MLYNEAIKLDCGIKIWGSAYTPDYSTTGGWGFALRTEEASAEMWKTIPDDIDILMTHGPPHGILGGGRHGDAFLKKEIEERVKPKFHVFGHVHSGYGVDVRADTTYINAAICDS